MAKYFSGVTLVENRFTISIIDDNLNIIFMDCLELERLNELLKRKSILTISVDAPLMLYQKSYLLNPDCFNYKIKKRSIDNLIASRNLMTYQNRFYANKNAVEPFVMLYKQLESLGFSYRISSEEGKSLIESYPDTSLIAIGLQYNSETPQQKIILKKLELVKSKGVRINSYFKTDGKYANKELDTLIQAYTSYLYIKGEASVLGTPDEGIIAIPGKDILNKFKINENVIRKKTEFENIKQISSDGNLSSDKNNKMPQTLNKPKAIDYVAEYCGAQYLYTNTDGVIRISDLRPIKSYRPFSEIYEMSSIKQVQVIIGTTDGLKKVKAELIPYPENSNIFKAADDENKKKLDSFWGDHGDKRGYLIKFNKVEVIKA